MDLVYVDAEAAAKEATRTLNYSYTVIHERDCACTNCTAYKEDRRCTQVCFGCFADCPTNPYGMARVLTREAYRERMEEKDKLAKRRKHGFKSVLEFWMPRIMKAYDDRQLLKGQESLD